MISRIEFIISETFTSLRRHPGMAFAAIVCVAAALFVSGLVGLIFLNGQDFVSHARDRFRIVVFFKTRIPREKTRQAYEKIRDFDQVVRDETSFISKETAWERVQHKEPDLVQHITSNPLPDSVEVKLRQIEDLPALTRELTSWPEVDRVREPLGVSTFLQDAGKFISRFGPILGILLIALSLVIIHHTIELTLYARRKEIHIMALVGATPPTVALPFLLEGSLYGLVGGAAALGVLYPLYWVLLHSVQTQYGVTLLNDADALTRAMYALLLVGLSLGVIGSGISVLKYMHNPRSKTTNA